MGGRRTRSGKQKVRMLVSLAVLGTALAAPIDPDALDTAMAAAQNEARACHAEATQRDWRLAGEVVVQASVGPEGRVSGAKVVRSSVTDPELVGCVLRAMNGQTVDRPGGGGFTPVTHAFVLWNPPADAKPVKQAKAERMVQSAMARMTRCMESAHENPGRLDVDLLVLGRRVHPVTGSLPPEHARCVYAAFVGAHASGAGLVQAGITFDEDREASVGRVVVPGAPGSDVAER